jgi:hypothetical protein
MIVISSKCKTSRRKTWVAICGILLLAMWAVALQAAGGNEVIGTYRVVEVASLGTDVRVTLRIRLVNNTQDDLSITQFGLRPPSGAAQSTATSAWANLRPRESASFTSDFTIPRAEYERWKKGVPPTLAVTFQPAGGREITRGVALLLSRMARPK